jgi:hypothetical protein
VQRVPNLELCDAFAPEMIWKDSRVAQDLASVCGGPAHILAPLRAPSSLAEERWINTSGIYGEEAAWCDELRGKVHQEAQLFVV